MKRMTKKRLKERIRDIALTAGIEDVDSEWWVVNVESIGRLFLGISECFNIASDHRVFLYWNIEEYENLERSTDLIWRYFVNDVWLNERQELTTK